MAGSLNREASPKAETLRNLQLLTRLVSGDTTKDERDIIEVEFALHTAAHTIHPLPVPGNPLTSFSTPENLKELRERRAAGLQLDPQDVTTRQDYCDWRIAVTDAEGENASRLRALLGARQVLRRTGDPEHAEIANGIDKVVRDSWRLGQIPDFEDRAKLSEFCRSKTRDYAAMPREWRYV
jgi:hypothetical protein